jgi:hypothetical protein
MIGVSTNRIAVASTVGWAVSLGNGSGVRVAKTHAVGVAVSTRKSYPSPSLTT